MSYHSALKPALNTSLSFEPFRSNGCSVCQFDIMTESIPEDFADCDMFYSEPPWKAGFNVFENRSCRKSPERTFEQLLDSINRFIAAVGKPSVLVLGRYEAARLKKPIQDLPTTLRGAPARALIYGMRYDGSTKDAWTILESLLPSFTKVGDVFAGYGNTGLIAKRLGKKFALSDYDESCVTIIRHNKELWR